MKKLFLPILFVFVIIQVKAQIGNEFWFAAPDVSFEHYSNSVPLNLHVSAMYKTRVSISQPANPTFTPVEFDLLPMQSQEIRLDSLLNVSDIEVYARAIAAGNFIQDKGFLITSSPGEISAYYDISGRNNTDIIALKAHNALGTDFWVSTQRKYKNHEYADSYSGFTVVATEDGTVVNIDPNGNNLEHHGTVPFSITLNRGQTFAVRAAGQAAISHIHGIHVTSDNDIAITIYDDSMQIDDGGGNWDIFADQLVPTDVVGMEYVVLKGNVQDNATPVDGEAIFITPTEDGTDIYINGVLDTSGLNAGDYFDYVITDLSTHVMATKPVYVNHVTGYSTNVSGARELGGAILPPVDKCTGSHSVTTKRTPATGFVYFNNLMVRNDTTTGSPYRNLALYNFTYSINGGAPVQIPPAHFTYIMDSAFAFYDITKAGGAAYFNNVIDGDVLTVENPIARFHLGIMQGRQSPGCKYGYFSDFVASNASSGFGGFLQENTKVFCNLNPIQMVASGGTSYEWFAPNDPLLENMLDDTNVPDPYFFPDTAGTYYFNVVITGECQTKDTLQNQIIVMESADAEYTVSEHSACKELSPVFTNTSDSIIGVDQIWTFKQHNGVEYQISQDTMSREFVHSFPFNSTDSTQIYYVELSVSGAFNSCPTKQIDTFYVYVYSNFVADFSMQDTLRCGNPELGIVNLSEGGSITTETIWLFSDGEVSNDDTPQKSVVNEGDTIWHFSTKLVLKEEGYCSDSITKSTVIMPNMTSTPLMVKEDKCAPTGLQLSVSGAVNVDSASWYISSNSTNTSVHTNPDQEIMHRVIVDGLNAMTDTISVIYIAENNYGCTDTVVFDDVIVYQTPSATIIDADSAAYSSKLVEFECKVANQDYFNWDFGNGNQSTSEVSSTTYHVIDTTEYVVQLIAYNNVCSDTAFHAIQVYPELSSNIENTITENNCKVYFNNTGLNIEWGYEESDVRLRIVDKSGREVYYNTVRLMQGKNYIEDINIPNDIYFIKLEGSKTGHVYKVIN